MTTNFSQTVFSASLHASRMDRLEGRLCGYEQLRSGLDSRLSGNGAQNAADRGFWMRNLRREDLGVVRPEGDSLGVVWYGLEHRHRTVLELRSAGHTLAHVGDRFGVTRERARQIEQSAEAALRAGVDAQLPHFREEVLAAIGAQAAVSVDVLGRTLRVRSTVALEALLGALEVERPQIWAGELAGWWTRSPGALDLLLRELAAQAPFPSVELRERVVAMGLADSLPVAELLSCEQSPLMYSAAGGGGWVRRSSVRTDTAFLWLVGRTELPTSGAIAVALGWPSNRSVRQALGRDHRFLQLRPEGTWVVRGVATREGTWAYRSAVEALEDVLRERGPLSLDVLVEQTMARYPVRKSWIKECLSSGRVGHTREGLYDLVERGAVAVEDGEPRQPESVAEAPDGTIDVRLRVDPRLLRGDAVRVSRWLTWRLGLRQTPSSQRFDLQGLEGEREVVLHRRAGASALSSLRAAAHSLDVVAGCEIVVQLRPKLGTADIRHSCDLPRCPRGH